MSEALVKEVARLQAEKENLKLRNQIFRVRTDLPIERTRIHDDIEKAFGREQEALQMRDLCILALQRATGETKEAIVAAPLTCAIEAEAKAAAMVALLQRMMSMDLEFVKDNWLLIQAEIDYTLTGKAGKEMLDKYREMLTRSM